MIALPLSRASQRFAAAAAIVLLAAGAAAGAELVGRASRRSFDPPPEMRGARWATVPDAAAAARIWLASGLRGRVLVVLTGRWGRPAELVGSEREEHTGARAALGDRPIFDVEGAVFAAARGGVAREIFAVMPPAAFERRRGAILAAKETVAGPGWARQTYHGFPRTFSTPDTLPRIEEPVLLLVEPSFFEAGTPASVPGWLARRGLGTDLALLALDDPAASDAQRDAASAFAASVSSVSVDAEP